MLCLVANMRNLTNLAILPRVCIVHCMHSMLVIYILSTVAVAVACLYTLKWKGSGVILSANTKQNKKLSTLSIVSISFESHTM